MSVTMRIIQQYDIRAEREFMALEARFAALEAARPDYPKGQRMKPISAAEPTNTLIWECRFPDIRAAQAALTLFEGDAAHEELFRQQVAYFQSARVEFFENLDF
jgi:hypothetical protein